MKKLIIVRHAKSSWEHEMNDKDRPLMPRGIERAKQHAIILKEKLKEKPDFWVSSYATRALQTAVIFASEFESLENLNIRRELYTFSPQDLRNQIQLFSDDLDFVMLFGHNEACRLVISDLTNENLFEFKTASIAMIEFEQNSWKNIADGELKFIISKEEIH